MCSQVSLVQCGVGTFKTMIYMAILDLCMFVQVAFGKKPFATNTMLYVMIALVAQMPSMFKAMVVQVTFKCKAFVAAATWEVKFLLVI